MSDGQKTRDERDVVLRGPVADLVRQGQTLRTSASKPETESDRHEVVGQRRREVQALEVVLRPSAE